MKYLLVSLLLLFSILSGIAQDELNRTWFLISLTIDGELQEIPENYFPNLELKTNLESSSQIMGLSICNSYSAQTSFTENTIIIDFVDETRVDCDFSFDQLFINFFRNTNGNAQILGYQLEDQEFLSNDRLTLTNDREEIAVFGKFNPQLPEEITQESWYLDYIEIDEIIEDYPSFDPIQYQQFSISEFLSSGDLLQSFTCQEDSQTEFTSYSYYGQGYVSVAIFYLLASDCGPVSSRQFDYSFVEQLEVKTHTYEIIEEGQGRRLILTDENGNRIFYTNAFLSTEDIGASPAITISPNPAADVLFINSTVPLEPLKMMIFNLQGQRVVETDFKSQIDVSDLAQGLYFIKFKGETQESVHRFIKQ